MGQLEDMQVFIKVVEAGSITKAAEQLNLAKSAVSKRLGELESRLGSTCRSRRARAKLSMPAARPPWSYTRAGMITQRPNSQILGRQTYP